MYKVSTIILHAAARVLRLAASCISFYFLPNFRPGLQEGSIANVSDTRLGRLLSQAPSVPKDLFTVSESYHMARRLNAWLVWNVSISFYIANFSSKPLLRLQELQAICSRVICFRGCITFVASFVLHVMYETKYSKSMLAVMQHQVQLVSHICNVWEAYSFAPATTSPGKMVLSGGVYMYI